MDDAPAPTVSIRLRRRLAERLKARYPDSPREWQVNRIVEQHLAATEPPQRLPDPVEAFLATFYQYDDEGFEPRARMYALYRDYVGDSAVSGRAFYRELDSRRLARATRRGVRGFRGVRRRRGVQVRGAGSS
jgi:hypothetical protein